MSIRRAGVRDAAAMTAVHHASRAVAYAHLGTPEQARGQSTPASWEATLLEADAWVYERDGVIVGFVSVHGETLTGLYVLPDEQGRGIGDALHAVAVEHGARELWVYEDNPGARAFYERRGWIAEPETLTSEASWWLPAPALRYVLP